MVNNNRNLLLAIAALIALVNNIPAALAEPAPATDVPKTKTTAQAPIIIEADKLYYSEDTGDYFAQGQVQITKDTDQVLSEKLHGNAQKGEVRAEETATLLQPGLSLTGTNILYNYQDRTGEMQSVAGKIEKIYVGGKTVSLVDGKVTVHDGTVTGCPAEKPHYYVGADRVEVWPGDKLIAYNAKIVIGKMTLFSMPKLEKSLKQETTTTLMPRIGYDSDDGFMIGQYLSYPVGNQTTLYTDLRYFTERGFEPQFGMTAQGKGYTVDAFHGSVKNDDDEWIKKEQEYTFALKPQKIGQSPLNFQFSASTGKWTEGEVSGWRRGYEAYIAADPFKLSDTLSLKVGTGYENVYYGYNRTYNDIWRFDTDLNWQARRTDAWLGYSYRHQTNPSVYEYDRIDMPRELRAGFLYQVDTKNKLGVSVKYDIDRSRPDELKYTWRHNIHCFDADISYDTKQDSLSLKLTAVNW
jgi:LPS-assembly protein